MQSTERWLAVVGWEDKYEVSELGRVRRTTPGGKYPAGHVLTPLRVRGGYVRVELNRDNKRQAFYIHRLVLNAFVGPRSEGQEALHGNTRRDDNRLSNLRWGTRAENMQDRLRDGNNPMASKTHCLRGHAFTEENTYLYRGNRCCRACKRIRKFEYRERLARKREAAA
jgi:hypothetical protein|nr:NUMOD4 motif-containing HNH endonuclease [Rhodococcus erythropolis]